jgi:DNA-binding Lrp family transcriptional regulator
LTMKVSHARLMDAIHRLEEEGKPISAAAISRIVGISPAAIAFRLRRLIRNGVISGTIKTPSYELSLSEAEERLKAIRAETDRLGRAMSDIELDEFLTLLDEEKRESEGHNHTPTMGDPDCDRVQEL